MDAVWPQVQNTVPRVPFGSGCFRGLLHSFNHRIVVCYHCFGASYNRHFHHWPWSSITKRSRNMSLLSCQHWNLVYNKWLLLVTCFISIVFRDGKLATQVLCDRHCSDRTIFIRLSQGMSLVSLESILRRDVNELLTEYFSEFLCFEMELESKTSIKEWQTMFRIWYPYKKVREIWSSMSLRLQSWCDIPEVNAMFFWSSSGNTSADADTPQIPLFNVTQPQSGYWMTIHCFRLKVEQ